MPRSRQPPIKRERVRVREAAAILGVSARTVQMMAARGTLPSAAKVGSQWTFNEDALRQWLLDEEVRQRPTPPRPMRAYPVRPSPLPDHLIDEAYRRAIGLPPDFEAPGRRRRPKPKA